MKKFELITFLILCYLQFILSGCKKQEFIPQQLNTTISISPSSGTYNTLVTIKGFGFSAEVNGNVVRFNNKEAVIQSMSATQLKVLVPKAAGSGLITVQTGSKTFTSPVFQYIKSVVVSTLAGNGQAGINNGTGGDASFIWLNGITNDQEGNVYVTETSIVGSLLYEVRKISPAAEVSNLQLSRFPGDNPTGITTDLKGNLYVSDQNSTISKISPTGLVTFIAGNQNTGLKDGQGTSAQFTSPSGLACDTAGTIYVADTYNNCIRKITVQGNVSTFAGSIGGGFIDGINTNAKFSHPSGIACDTKGNVYVADINNNCIRKITDAGIVTTLAGNGKAGFRDGKNTDAEFVQPSSIATDTANNIYVADEGNNRIRKIAPDGTVTTLAGNGIAGFADGSGLLAQFNHPNGITCDKHGNIYITDPDNNRVRKITIE